MIMTNGLLQGCATRMGTLLILWYEGLKLQKTEVDSQVFFHDTKNRPWKVSFASCYQNQANEALEFGHEFGGFQSSYRLVSPKIASSLLSTGPSLKMMCTDDESKNEGKWSRTPNCVLPAYAFIDEQVQKGKHVCEHCQAFYLK